MSDPVPRTQPVTGKFRQTHTRCEKEAAGPRAANGRRSAQVSSALCTSQGGEARIIIRASDPTYVPSVTPSCLALLSSTPPRHSNLRLTTPNCPSLFVVSLLPLEVARACLDLDYHHDNLSQHAIPIHGLGTPSLVLLHINGTSHHSRDTASVHGVATTPSIN